MSDREPLEQVLAPAIDEGRIAAAWNRIAGARTRKRTPKARGWLLAGAAVAAIAMVTIIAWPQPHRDWPLASRDPWVSTLPGVVWTQDVSLDDNSTIALGASTRLQVLANEGTRFSTLLQTGTAHFDVQPGGPRRWEIETALASVEVVGTAFTVTLDDHRLTVEVDRGVVMVHGERVPGRVVRLMAGQRIVVTAPVTAAVAPIAQAPIVPAPPPPPTPIAHTQPPKHVHHIEVAQAPPAPVHQPSVAEVVAEADRLSSAGDAAGAAAVLERVRARDTSGLVSFTLGRLYLDVLGKAELAAVAFNEVIARGSPRSLLEDAYARRVEALHRAGNRDRAVAALVNYERAYPQGRRIAALHAMLGAQ
jgi:transmembrane sensor